MDNFENFSLIKMPSHQIDYDDLMIDDFLQENQSHREQD